MEFPAHPVAGPLAEPKRFKSVSPEKEDWKFGYGWRQMSDHWVERVADRFCTTFIYGVKHKLS